MRNKTKVIFLSCLLLTVILLATSCSSDLSPFKDFDEDGYTVSVKYDANGGLFTTNTETIIDTYNVKDYTADSEGNVELKLFAPEDKDSRGNQAYTASKENFFLAGWYTERNEIKDENGNVTGYTYGGFWDFKNDKLEVSVVPKRNSSHIILDFKNGEFEIPANKNYSSENPIITLYAAWISSLTYEFYTFDESGNPILLETKEISPIADNTSLKLPSFDEKTGMVNAPNDFPKLEGKTYNKIYTDIALTNEVTTQMLNHSGKFLKESAELENPVMKIYCTYTDGVQYRIDSPNKLINSANSNATYIIESDLDFNGKYWPKALSTQVFTGNIIGNGHTINNVKITQNDGTNTRFGLFGAFSKDASISDITFENITVNINSGSGSKNASFAILAGEIEDGADINGITLKNSEIIIARNATVYVSVVNNNPGFGLIFADGSMSGITFSTEDVKVSFSENGSYSYTYTLDENGCFTLTAA